MACMSRLRVRVHSLQSKLSMRSIFSAVVVPRLVKINTLDATSAPTLSEMRQFLRSNGCQVSTGYTCLKLACPYCADPSVAADKGIKSREKQLFINMTTGHCQCQCSKVWGSWTHLTDSLTLAQRQAKKQKAKPPALPKEQSCDQAWRSEVAEASALWEKSQRLEELRSDAAGNVRDRFEAGLVSTETFDRFSARTDVKRKKLVFPHYGPETQMRRASIIEPCKQDQDEDANYPLSSVKSTVIPRDNSKAMAEGIQINMPDIPNHGHIYVISCTINDPDLQLKDWVLVNVITQQFTPNKLQHILGELNQVNPTHEFTLYLSPESCKPRGILQSKAGNVRKALGIKVDEALIAQVVKLERHELSRTWIITHRDFLNEVKEKAMIGSRDDDYGQDSVFFQSVNFNESQYWVDEALPDGLRISASIQKREKVVRNRAADQRCDQIVILWRK